MFEVFLRLTGCEVRAKGLVGLYDWLSTPSALSIEPQYRTLAYKMHRSSQIKDYVATYGYLIELEQLVRGEQRRDSISTDRTGAGKQATPDCTGTSEPPAG